MNPAKQTFPIALAPDIQQEQMPYDPDELSEKSVQMWTSEELKLLLRSCKNINSLNRGSLANMAQHLSQQDLWMQSGHSANGIRNQLKTLGVKIWCSNDDLDNLLESSSHLKSKQSMCGGRVVSTTLDPILKILLSKEESGIQSEECESISLPHRDLKTMKEWVQKEKNRSQIQLHWLQELQEWLQQERAQLVKGDPLSSYAPNRPIVYSLTSSQQCPSSFAYQNAEAVFKFHDSMLPAVRDHICAMWQHVPDNLSNLSQRLDHFCEITPYTKESMCMLLTDRAQTYQKKLEERV